MEEGQGPFPEGEGKRSVGISQRQKERSTREEGLIMAKWHPFVGPADYLLPDEEDNVYHMFGMSAAIYGATLLGNAVGTWMDYRLVVHPATGNLVRREILRQGGKKAGQATIWRGLGLFGSANPYVGLAISAAFIATSIPPSTRDSLQPQESWASHYFASASEYAAYLESQR